MVALVISIVGIGIISQLTSIKEELKKMNSSSDNNSEYKPYK